MEHHGRFLQSHGKSLFFFSRVQETLLTCTMEVLSKEKGLVQFKMHYNKKAIKKRILAGKGSRVELVPKSSKFVSKETEV